MKDFAGEEITDEIEDAKQKKITDVYGADLISGIQRARAKKRHLYIFSPEDLDNDDIISMVEMSPTYQRDKATLDTICSKAVVETEAFEEDASDENSRIITF